MPPVPGRLPFLGPALLCPEVVAMPKRSVKDTIAKASEVDRNLGDDYRFTRDPELAEQRSKRRRDRSQRARKRSIAGLFTPCIAPGCKGMTSAHLRSGIELAICSLHAAAVWESVEEDLNSRDPFMAQCFDALRARREIIRAEWRKQDEAERAEWDAERKRPDMPGEIYYVRANGLIKVGWTTNIENRLRAYGANAELLCHFPGTRADEAALHRNLTPSRAKGREWYADDAIIRAFVARAVREHGSPTAAVKWTEPAKSAPRAKAWR